MAPRQFKTPPQAPPTFTATPESLLADTRRLIARSKKVQDDVVKHISPDNATFDNVILPCAQDENKMSLEARVIGFYRSVSTDKELRNASSEARKELSEFAIESAMREDLFKLVDAVLKKGEELDPESRRLLEKEHRNYISYGLGVPAGPKRDRFKEISKRLSEVQIKFQRTLNEENGGLWFTPEQLEGVPEDLVNNLKKGEAGSENAGKVWLSFKYPDLHPALKYALNSEVRKEVFLGNENRCNSNVPHFKEAILLRDEAARILGYNNHAEFGIEENMAKTPETVHGFLNDLRERLTPGGLEEMKKLMALKEEDLKARGKSSEFDGHYYLWDHRFYDRLMLEKDYSLDQEKVSEYFPLHHTILAMLHTFEELFGLVFIEVVGADRDTISPTGKGDDIVWHPDVQLFSVWEEESEGEGGGFLGYLYLDLFPREGKYTHAGHFSLGLGFTDENGKRRHPVSALVCNFTKPKLTKPSLLKHREVVTLFHELGHGIHGVSGKTIYSRFHGTRTVRDFCEAPSQMLENWCWTPSQLKALSKHYSSVSAEYAATYAESASSAEKPSETIPDDLIERIVRTKHVNSALANLHQLHISMFDMKVHGLKTHEEGEEMNMSEVYNKLQKEIYLMDGPEVHNGSWGWGNRHAAFGHLVGGYDAGYYGYLYSRAYSADMFFSVFAADPMNKKEGRRYRHAVLEKGGSQEEMKTLEDFLGRKPNSEVFYKELGLDHKQ